MSKNVEFETLLKNKTILSGKDAVIRNKAFDDLLKVDPANTAAFRNALIANKDFWKAFPEFGIPENDIDSFIRSDEFLNPANDAFAKFHKLVAEQRVSLGLKNVTDDVLIRILKNNEDACRNYLATKTDVLNLGDVTATNGWINNPGLILTDEVVKKIQKEAAELYLIRCIEKSVNQTFLANFKNTGSLNDAKALGYPQNDGDNAFPAPISEAVKSAIDKSIRQLNEKKKSFADYVKNMTQEQIKSYMEGFKTGNFIITGSSLDDAYNNLNQADKDWAEHLVNVRCLQDFLLNNKSNNLMQAFKENDLAAFQIKIKNLLGFEYNRYNKLHQKLTEPDIKLLKQSIFPAIINQQTDLTLLDALQKAKDFTEFKKVLKEKLDIVAPDWINEDNFRSFQATARSRQFVLQLDKYSDLGSGAHKQLIKAFNKLGPNQQNELIKSENLKHLLNAVDENVVKHFLGKDFLKKGIVIKDLIDENKRLSVLKGIHNSEVARVLASFEPPLALTEEKVNEINELFVENGVAIMLDNIGDYESLINKIAQKCGVNEIEKEDFRKAFGLVLINLNLTDSPVIENLVKQHEYNSYLFMVHLNSDDPVKKQFLDKVLSASKTEKIYDDLYKKLKESKDLQDFSNKANLDLSNVFTNYSFNAIKAQIRKEKIHHGGMNTVKEEIKVLDTKLSELKKTHTDLTQHKEKLRKMSEIDPIHIYNPAVQGKAEHDPKGMEEKFKEMGQDCDLIVDQLRREQIILQDCLDSLPDTTVSEDARIGTFYSQEKQLEINKMRKKLEIEKELVEQDLRIYEKVQNTISGDKGILKMIENALKGQRYGFKKTGSGVTWKDVSNLNEVQMTFPPNTNTNKTKAIIGGKGPTPKIYELVEKIPPGKMRVYDVTYEQTAGRFTEKMSNDSPVTSKDGKVIKSPPEEFVVEAFPKGGPNTTVTDEALIRAKVDFSMAMAAQILASMDSKPDKNHPIILEGSDPEELEYLWTALKVLGERTPHMKFGAESIKVNSNAFNPKDKMGRFFWDKNSLYKTAFKGDLVDKYVDNLTNVSEEKFGHKSEIKQVNKTVETLTGLFKGKLQDTKEKVEETIKKEGPAPKLN